LSTQSSWLLNVKWRNASPVCKGAVEIEDVVVGVGERIDEDVGIFMGDGPPWNRGASPRRERHLSRDRAYAAVDALVRPTSDQRRDRSILLSIG
jgi:hypothetical protein